MNRISLCSLAITTVFLTACQTPYQVAPNGIVLTPPQNSRMIITIETIPYNKPLIKTLSPQNPQIVTRVNPAREENPKVNPKATPTPTPKPTTVGKPILKAQAVTTPSTTTIKQKEPPSSKPEDKTKVSQTKVSQATPTNPTPSPKPIPAPKPEIKDPSNILKKELPTPKKAPTPKKSKEEVPIIFKLGTPTTQNKTEKILQISDFFVDPPQKQDITKTTIMSPSSSG